MLGGVYRLLNLWRLAMTSDIKTLLKGLVLRLTPQNILQLMKKVHYARSVRSISEKDEPELKVIRHLLAPGHHAADLGANVGVYTNCLSELVGMSGRVYSVEPIPLTFEILRFNVQTWRLKNVELINCAISDINGCATMEVPLYESGGENFYGARVVTEKVQHGPLRRVGVLSATVDSLFSELDPAIYFIKCDVEGHDLSCIRGAIQTIRNSKPAWLIEISGDPDDENSPAHETFAVLLGNGYEAYWFDGTTLRLRRSAKRSVNYFFLTDEHLRVLEQRGLPVERSG
jgi:FkbM family methyltransferase